MRFLKLDSDGINAAGPESHEPEVKSPEQIATASKDKHESQLWRILKLTRWAVPISGIVLAVLSIENFHFKDLLSHQEGLLGLLHEIGIHIDTQDVIDNTSVHPADVIPSGEDESGVETKPAPQEAPKVEKPAVAGAPHTPHVEVVRPTEDAYQTARNNLGGVTTKDGVHHGGIATEIAGLTDPTEAQVAATQQAIATKLGVNPWEVPPDTAREALLNGGFSDSGHSYELWQDNSGDTIRLVEHPTDDLNTLPDTHTPEMEISDMAKDQLITGTAVLHDRDLVMRDFASDNEFEPGSPEYAAWNNIHLFLKDHESVYGTGWQQSTESLNDYLNRIGVYKE